MKNLKVFVIFVGVCVSMIFSVPLYAALDWDIEGGIDNYITEGQQYDTVNLLNDAKLSMSGGYVFHIYTYDSSILNISGGQVETMNSGGHNKTTITGGIFSGVGATEYGTVNLYGGTLQSISSSGSAQFHVYGQELTITDNWLIGKWANEEEVFHIYMRGPSTKAAVVLHEIPEPFTLVLFGLGGLLIRRG